MKMNFQLALRSAVAVAAIAISSTASADTYRWTFSDWAGDDGEGDISGWFDYDSTNGSVFNWDIRTSTEWDAPTEERFSGHYTSGNSTLGTDNDLHVVSNEQADTFGGLRSFAELRFDFNTSLSQGGTVYGHLMESNAKFHGDISQGASFSMIATPVPEPEVLGMGLAGLALVGAMLRQRRRSEAAAAR